MDLTNLDEFLAALAGAPAAEPVAYRRSAAEEAEFRARLAKLDRMRESTYRGPWRAPSDREMPL